MQGKRIGRRKRVFFLLFFVLFFFIYFYLQGKNIFLRDLPFLVKTHKIEWGLWRGIIFNNVVIYDKGGKFFLTGKKGYLNFSLKEIFFKRNKRINRFSGKLRDGEIFIKNVRLPLKINTLEIIREGEKLIFPYIQGSLFGNIPFELKARVEKISTNNPLIDLRCFFSESPSFLSFLTPAIISMSGDINNLLLKGLGINSQELSPLELEGEILPFQGKINLKCFLNYLSKSKKGALPVLNLEGEFKDNKYLLRINFDHFYFGENELITNIYLENQYYPQENLLEGKIYTSGTVLNFFPFPEFEGEYRFKDGVFHLSELRWADSLNLTGDINFSEKLFGELVLSIEGLNLSYFAYLYPEPQKATGVNPGFGIYYPDWTASGLVSGKVIIGIRNDGIILEGKVDFTEGEFGPFKFKGGRIEFKGENNILKLTQARVYQEDGYLDFTGELDLKRLGKPEFGKNLIVLPFQDRINWQGWTFSRTEPGGPIRVEKGIDERLSIGFRSYLASDSSDITDEKQDEFGVEYKLREKRTLRLRLKENEEILGFEHKIKF